MVIAQFHGSRMEKSAILRVGVSSITLKEAAKLLGTVSDDDFDRWVDPEKMV